jgi:hypothetical protein
MPEFEETRDFEAEFYSAGNTSVLVAEYIDGEFKIVGESEQ